MASTSDPLEVVVVPVLQDNYAYLVIDKDAKVAAAVDPVEPDKLIAAAAEHGVTITAVLTTHQHWDHSGGNEEIVSKLPDLVVFGGKGDSVPAVTRELGHGDEFQIRVLQGRTLFTPCHTPGHVLYHITSPGHGPGVLFTGDTLFVSGCGRFNSGTPAQMHRALCEYIPALDGETRIYCGHEYTVNNLKFALAVEPENPDYVARMAWAVTKREAGEPTVPSTVADELKCNPFIRVTEDAVKAYTGKTDPIEVLAELRQLKNRFGLGAGKK